MEVRYNGIDLGYVRTHEITDTPALSDDGTDYLFTKRSIGVQCLFNAGIQPALFPSEGPEKIMARVAEALETPRGVLQLRLGGGAPWFAVSGPDVANGPTPKKLAVTRVDGTATWIIDYEIECNYIPACQSGGGRPTYLTNRWKETATIDENFYTTYTRTGKLVTRGDVRINPDAFRGVVCPPIIPGFRALPSEYTVQEDGLALLYTFRQQEVYLEPPSPATKASGEFVESTQNGALRHGEVRVSLEGPKTASKTALLGLAIKIAVQRLEQAGPATKGGKWIGGSSIKEDLYDNKCEVRIRTNLGKLTARFQGVNSKLDKWGQPPFGSGPGTRPPDPGTRGTADLALVAAALGDPCVVGRNAALVGGVAQDQPMGVRNVPEARITVVPMIPTDFAALVSDDAEADGIYALYKIRTTDIEDEHIVQLPVTKAGADPVLVQLANPTTKRIVDWTAERVGTTPDIPDPASRDTGLTLLKKEIVREEPELSSDGTQLKYTVSGRYVFAVKKSKVSSLATIGGLPPWMAPLLALDEKTNTLKFVQGIFDFAFGASLSTGGPQLQG